MKEQLYVWQVHLRGQNFKIVATTAEKAIEKARSMVDKEKANSTDLVGLICGEKVDAVAK
jgi:hypothetical protein